MATGIICLIIGYLFGTFLDALQEAAKEEEERNEGL